MTMFLGVLGLAEAEPVKKPNIILIFTDDQGYGDLGCFGSKTIQTPNIDSLAKRGRLFTSCMVPSPLCSPSRAGLLTGSYPKRVSMERGVLFPHSGHGLNPAENTIADQLRGEGYATGCFGKWHLGHQKEVLPQANGFDVYFGIPYSNDMNHPENQDKPSHSSDDLWKDQKTSLTLWKTPLVEGSEIVELPVNQQTITRRYTDRAIEFIQKNKENPFFVYLPHSMPHIPLYVPDDVYDPNPENAYKCTIEHIDAEVGRLLESLKKEGLEENTYVIYTTDNGPWLKFKNHGGSAGPLRGGKAETWEGGMRVPCVMAGPGIPAGTTSDALISTIDFLPTIASLVGSDLPEDRKIDGLDISNLIKGDSDSPREEFLYYTKRGELSGIRQGEWKLLREGRAAKEKVWLFHITTDKSEQFNVSGEHPQKVEALRERMNVLDAEITKEARPIWGIHKPKKPR